MGDPVPVRTLEEIATSALAKLGFGDDHMRVQLYAQSIVTAALREAVAQERAALREYIARVTHGRVLNENLLFKFDLLEWLDAREKSE